MYSMSLVTLINEGNLLRLWVPIFVLHDVRCPRQNKFVYCSMFLFCFPHVMRVRSRNNELSKKHEKSPVECLFTGDAGLCMNTVLHWSKSAWKTFVPHHFFLSSLNLHRCSVHFVQRHLVSSDCSCWIKLVFLILLKHRSIIYPRVEFSSPQSLPFCPSPLPSHNNLWCSFVYLWILPSQRIHVCELILILSFTFWWSSPTPTL